MRVEFYNSDFEMAAIGAVKQVWGNLCIINGCFFHFQQAMWRKIVAHGMRNQYVADEQFQIQLRCIPAIAFVPAADCGAVFDAVAVWLITSYPGVAGVSLL